jgi:hypothetical protein
MKRLLFNVAAPVLFALLQAAPAQAGLIFTLDLPVVFGAPGTEFDVTGSLLNPDTDPIFLNTASGSLSSPDLDFDYTNYFVVVPRVLNGGDSYSGPIFAIVVGPTALSGDYSGSFTIQGGIDGDAFNDLATQNFQVTVSSVPEPATLGQELAGILALGVATGSRTLRRRLKSRRLMNHL